jgi:putrescine transport system permease protein
MVVFSKVRLGVSPDINALATIMVAVVAVGIVIGGIAMSRQQKLRDRGRDSVARVATAAAKSPIDQLEDFAASA